MPAESVSVSRCKWKILAASRCIPALESIYAPVDEQTAPDTLVPFGERWDRKYPMIHELFMNYS